MPAKSAEAIERRRALRMERDRAKAAAKKSGVAPVVTPKKPNRQTMVFVRPVEMTKSELRAMFAEAMQNTARM